MNNSIEMEIVRLVKEIAEDEKAIVRAEINNCEPRAKRYKDSLDRKMKLLELLKK